MITEFIKYIEEKILWVYSYKKNRDQFLSSLADSFDNPNSLCKLYVWPRLQEKNPADEIHSFVDTSKPALEALKPFFDEENTHKDGRNHLIVLGDAGMGKSSFLLMLKLKSMRFFCNKKYKFELFKINSDVLDDISKIKDKLNTVLLLDALDEDVESWGNIKSRLSCLIESTLGFRKVIITCRTQFFPVEQKHLLMNSGIVKIQEYRVEALFLSLFREKDISLYLKKKFGFDKEKIIRSKAVIFKMKDLKARPLILSHIDDILNGSDDYTDMFSIYSGMITAWLERESRKNKHLNSEVLRESCILIAKYMSSKKSRKINIDKLNKLTDIGAVSINLDKVDIGGRSLLNKNSDGDFRFSHFSIQEFLVAESIVLGYMDLNSFSEINITDLMKQFILQGSGSKNILADELPGKCSSAYVKLESFSNSEYERVFTSESNLPNIIMYSVVDRGLKRFLCMEKTMYYECVISKTMVRADLLEVDFIKCNMRGCSFEYSRITNSRFHTCSLNDLVMEGSVFEGVVFMKTDFSNSTLKDSQFESCSFIECLFMGTDLEGVKFNNCTIDNPEVINHAKCLERAVMDEGFLKGFSLSALKKNSSSI
uniref:pentapeptide repeat-containing protein n=1 Tax=Marinobacterium profundum TaxID=1714300 RepID=UPI000A890040|nr:pentapeptide repeat-containing protein [Marinobacterium profundum]